MASLPFYTSEIPVVFKNQILIPTNDKSHRFLLGPMGNSDPTWLINAETNRIPLKQIKPNVPSWKHTFRSWPSKLTGFRTWYKWIAAAKQIHWDEIGIGQCIALSLADTKKNEPLMSAATYFWSSTLNAFLFRQGPMTPTLIDIKMLTGLDIHSEINPFNLLINSSHKLKTKKIGGWSGYVAEHMETGSVSEREHVAFLTLWLERFAFCGSTCGPTLNCQHLAQALVEKRQFSLDRYLLGAVYRLLHSATQDLMLKRTVAHGGPWWFIQLWLTIYTNTMVDRPSLSDSAFPSDYTNNEDPSFRRYMSFGEAASMYPGADQSAEELSADSDFELPADLTLGELNDDMVARELFMIGITPCLLPVGVFQGRSTSLSYEFYSPMVAARQCGLGQLPISLHFHRLLESRGNVPSALVMSKVLETRVPNLGDCDRLWLSPFIHLSFQSWWQEWTSHLFHQSARFYLTELIDNISPQVPDAPTPSVSNSEQKISYALVLAPSGKSIMESTIGLTAPKVSSLLQGPIAKETPKRKVPIKEKIQKAGKKPKTDDQADLDALDPSIEEFLDDQVMEKEVGAAAANLLEEQDPSAKIAKEPLAKSTNNSSAATTKIPPTNDQADVAQPRRTRQAIPMNLADMFSFDIGQFLDDEDKEPPITTKASISDQLKNQLSDIANRLEASLESLVENYNPVRSRVQDIQDQLPKDLMEVLTPAVFLEQYNFKLHRAKERIAERRERESLESALTASKAQVNSDKTRLDELVVEPIVLKSRLEELCRLEVNLASKLEPTRREIQEVEAGITASPKAIED
uniref:OO_Ba0013J05-OO_Ba0033A15.20 protein n=1 Tax=Oryza officinalis TaxID=4535 RepID=D0ABG3_9ORYZ|nr:OO_Ba0013J05-OO_Ba0033A15.20 [Oryza officinalis]